MVKSRKNKNTPDAIEGRVIEMLGRKVRVETTDDTLVCHLAGNRVVIGDTVTLIQVQGGGGKITSVSERRNLLRRIVHGGRVQPLAANLGGLIITIAAKNPEPYLPLIDHYLVAARIEGLRTILVMTKQDLGITPEHLAALKLREKFGCKLFMTSSTTGVGIAALQDALHDGGPWALVGQSGVGKTTLLAAMLPGVSVGPTAAVSDRDGTGRHTTTRSRIFQVNDYEIADSPGIRTFMPDIADARTLRDHYPGVCDIDCKYRDCLHQEGEDGCKAPMTADPTLLASYRHTLNALMKHQQRRR